MRLYSRGGVWYVETYYWQDGGRHRARRSTGIRDSGQASRRVAEAAALDIAQSLATGSARQARPTTLKQALAALVSDMERAGRAQPTIDIALQKGAHLMAHFGPAKPVATLTAPDLAAYADAARRHRSAHTVHRELRTLRQSMRAVDVTPPPAPDLGTVYQPRERVLTRTEQAKLLAALPAHRRDYVLLYLRLGLSKSELYRLEPDWTAGEVRVRGTKTRARDRWLPLTPETRAILERRHPIEPWGNIDRDLRAACKRAQFEPVSCNDMRRTFATELATRGVPLLHAMHLMGHSTTRMLEQVYARVERGPHMHAAMAALCAECVPDTGRSADTMDT